MKKIILLLSLCCVTSLFSKADKSLNLAGKYMNSGYVNTLPDVDKLTARLDSIVTTLPDGTNSTKQVYEYDEDYIQTSEKLYTWVGGAWVLSKTYSYEWIEGDANRLLFAYEELEYTSADAYSGTRTEYSYDGNGFLASKTEIALVDGNQTLETKKTYVNDTKGNPTEKYYYEYDGTRWEDKAKSTIIYDTEARELEVENYEWAGKWVGTSKYINTYDAVNGGYALREFLKWDDAFGAWVDSAKTVYEYNAENLPILETDSILLQDGSKWELSAEREITNSVNGKKEVKGYRYEAGKKLADKWNLLTYDDNGNLIEDIGMIGDGTEDGWVNSVKIQYEFGRDNINTRTYIYANKNGEWVKESGDGIDMDYNLSAEQLVVNAEYNNPYKLTYQYSYANDGSGEWVASVGAYYYSSLEESNIPMYGIESVSVSVYPNPVVDMLHIESPAQVQSVIVYNVNGAIVLQQNISDNQVNVSALPKGIYSLKINTATGAVVRKIVKE